MVVLEERAHRVVMLVNNTCTNDSRVIKTAEALQADGYLVTVIARMADGLKQSENINGVMYRRCSALPKDHESALGELHVILTQMVRADQFSWRQLTLALPVGLAFAFIYLCRSVIAFSKASSDYAGQIFGGFLAALQGYLITTALLSCGLYTGLLGGFSHTRGRC